MDADHPDSPKGKVLLPGDDALPSGDKALLPVNEALLPADEVLLPADEVLLPADEALLPADEALLPADEALLPVDEVLLPADEALLRLAIALSAQSRHDGNHPFAAVVADADGTVLAQGVNAWQSDCTGHAELNAVRMAWAALAGKASGSGAGLGHATLYSSAEPCAMCAGAIYWSGIGRVVYALSEARLLALTGNHPDNPTLSLPCREVFGRGQRRVAVLGPLLEVEAAAAHAGFWD